MFQTLSLTFRKFRYEILGIMNVVETIMKPKTHTQHMPKGHV